MSEQERRVFHAKARVTWLRDTIREFEKRVEGTPEWPASHLLRQAFQDMLNAEIARLKPDRELLIQTAAILSGPTGYSASVAVEMARMIIAEVDK